MFIGSLNRGNKSYRYLNVKPKGGSSLNKIDLLGWQGTRPVNVELLQVFENFKFFDVEVRIRINNDLFSRNTFNIIDQTVFFTMQ